MAFKKFLQIYNHSGLSKFQKQQLTFEHDCSSTLLIPLYASN